MSPLRLPDVTLSVRPIGPGDREALAEAFGRLSPESRLKRFLGPKPKLSRRELDYLTDIDHVTHEALAAFDPAGQLIAIARYATAQPEDCSAEIAVTVADAWQGRGIGPALAARVVTRARDNDFQSLTASTFGENAPALSLLARLGFRPCGASGGVLDFQLALTGAPC